MNFGKQINTGQPFKNSRFFSSGKPSASAGVRIQSKSRFFYPELFKRFLVRFLLHISDGHAPLIQFRLE